MAKHQVKNNDPDIAKVGVALERAAAKARQLGFATNTPVYVYRDGKMVDIVAEQRATRSTKKSRVKSSPKKTTPARGKTHKKNHKEREQREIHAAPTALSLTLQT